MKIVFFLVTVILSLGTYAQGQNGMYDEMKATEEKLVASTKQLNQFFRRFNGEEDEEGNRYYEGDKRYRDNNLRKKYIPSLFDQSNTSFNSGEIRDFAKESIKNPIYLNLHDQDLIAEVNTSFLYKGKSVDIQLFMKVQKQRKGYEWVIQDVYFSEYSRFFDKDTTETKPFVHPMSHELGFMNLRKAFKENPESFTSDSFAPDYLTLFIYDLKNGNLSFKTVQNVKYHFFGVENWYFEVSYYNRPGYNTGWLISNLVQVDNGQKKQLRDYIYGKY